MQYDEGANSSHFKEFLNKRWVKVVLIIDVLIVLAIIGVLIWHATKTATVNFSVAPIDAKITLNGQGDYKNGTYKLHPGNYEVTVSRDGLESKTFNLELKSGYVTTLAAFLTGENNSFEFYELKDNYASFQKLSEIASADNNQTTDQDTSAEGFIAKFQKAYQLKKEVLPIEDYEYKEDDGTSPQYTTVRDISILATDYDCQKTLCLKVKIKKIDTEDYTSYVDKILQERGFNLNLFEVKYDTDSYHTY